MYQDIVFPRHSTSTEELEKLLDDLEITGQGKTSQTSVFLRSVRLLRGVLDTWENLLSLKPQWKTINWRLCEKLSKERIIIKIVIVNKKPKKTVE